MFSNDEIIKSLDKNISHKYLGILETENIKNSGMKEQLTSGYKKNFKNIFKFILNTGNLTKAIWAVSIFRYSAGIIDWTKQEL